MEFFQTTLLVLQVIIAISLIILVLLQKSDGDSLSGIGGGSGGLNSVISKKSSANIMTKITMIMIGIFMINCLILGRISNYKNKAIEKDLEKVINQQENTQNPSSIPPVK